MVRTWFPTSRRRWLLRLMLVLSVSGAGVLAWVWQSQREHTNAHAEEGKRAPAFTLLSQTGAPVALASYLGRQPVVLVFYMGDF
jgi:peroxiredoxin